MTVYQLELCVYFWIAAGNTVMADKSLDIADEVLYATENYYDIIIRAFITCVHSNQHCGFTCIT